jgi:hypothetical protein
MLAHAMGADILPADVVEAIDKRCRAFSWTGDETFNGGNCKVAWEDVCIPEDLGGLGILSIESQNTALLTKFLTKLHSDTSVPWACWFRRRYGWHGSSRDLGDPRHLDTPVWKDIVASLETFRSVSKVTIGGGGSTAFWSDLWIGETTL